MKWIGSASISETTQFCRLGSGEEEEKRGVSPAMRQSLFTPTIVGTELKVVDVLSTSLMSQLDGTSCLCTHVLFYTMEVNWFVDQLDIMLRGIKEIEVYKLWIATLEGGLSSVTQPT